MVFTCGRPGCGRESSATLQIDAPSSTVTLVDPRISRDGVPLCAHHADATTPPMGWTMNDLRNQHRTAAPIQEVGPTTGDIVATNGSAASSGRGRSSSSRRNRDRGRSRDRAGRDRPVAKAQAVDAPDPSTDDDATKDELSFPVSRSVTAMEGPSPTGSSAAPDPATAASGPIEARPETTARSSRSAESRSARRAASRRRDQADNGSPASRPSRRRDEAEVAEAEAAEQGAFSWDFKYDEEDEKPEELQATTPLLSRAFRSSVG